ncbi:hypothetical protein AB0K68_18700 [Streptomyces sp. NPDC050698]
MSIVVRVYGYPSDHNAGSEWMLHSMLRPLAERGHRVTVWLSHPGKTKKTYEIDGVHVVPYQEGWTSLPVPPLRTCCCRTTRTLPHRETPRSPTESR